MVIFAVIVTLFLLLFFKPTRKILLALISLITLNAAGVSVGANIVNASLIGLLGIPGIVATTILNIIY